MALTLMTPPTVTGGRSEYHVRLEPGRPCLADEDANHYATSLVPDTDKWVYTYIFGLTNNAPLNATIHMNQLSVT